MKTAFFFFLMLGFAVLASAQVKFHGSFRNSIYSYESDQSHTRFYQYLRTRTISPCKKFIVQTSMRALTDANVSLTNEERFKVYSLRFDGKGLLDKKLDLAFGRLFLHPGTVLGALDGATVKYSFSRHFSLMAYGGVEGHFQRSFKAYELNDSQVLGGLFNVQRFYASKLQFLYVRKANDAATFWHLTGLNFNTALLPKTILRVQSHYDIENSRMHRFLFSARNTWTDNLMTTLEFKQQFPQIYADSYFTIFTPLAYQRIRLGAAYEFIPNYYVQFFFQHVMFEQDNANQLYATIGNTFGDIGLIWENGYAGDQLAVMLNMFYEVVPNLVASVYVDYSQYRLEEIYEYDNQLANAARLSYRIGRHWTIDVEYQWLTNKYKSSDSRFLNHIAFVW